MSQFTDPLLLMTQAHLEMSPLKRKSRDEELEAGLTIAGSGFDFESPLEFEIWNPYPSPPPRAYVLDTQPRNWTTYQLATIPRAQEGNLKLGNEYIPRLQFPPIEPKYRVDSPKHNAIAIQPPKKRVKETSKSQAAATPTHIVSDCGTRTWIVLKSLGKGGCGEVYLCTELGSKPNEFVAVKVIKERRQFNSELSTMKALAAHICGRGTLFLTRIHPKNDTCMSNIKGHRYGSSFRLFDTKIRKSGIPIYFEKCYNARHEYGIKF